MTKLELRSNGKDKYAIIGDKETIFLIWDMVRMAIEGTIGEDDE